MGKDRVTEYDEAAVVRTIAGETVHLYPVDRHEVVRRLHAQGLTDPEIAERTGWTKRTALRIRARLDLPPLGRNQHTLPDAEPTRPIVGDAGELTRHKGAAGGVRGDRSDGDSSFLDGFMVHPFNVLMSKTPDLPCRGEWELFSPPGLDNVKYGPHDLKEARALCAACPIFADCFEYAMTPGERGGAPAEFGIWAGTTEQDRKRLHKQRVKALAPASVR